MPPHGTLDAAIRAHARATPDAPALLSPGRSACSYADLAAHVDATIACLRAHLPAANRAVAVVTIDGATTCSSFVAAMAAGVCAPIDPASLPDDLDGYFGYVQPAVVIADDASIARFGTVFDRHGVHVARIVTRDEHKAGVFDLVMLPAVRDRGAALLEPGDDAVLLLRTSGTTSEPKIVPHTMAGLMHMIAHSCERLGMQPSDRCLNARPLYHVHAIVHVVGTTLLAGSSATYLTDAGAPDLVAGWDAWTPTWYSASPAMHREVLAIVRALPVPPKHSLRFLRSAAATLDPELSIEVQAALGVPILQGYGTTEAPTMTLNVPPPAEQKPRSVGRAAGCELRIVDGEVVARGGNVARAYATRGAPQPIVDAEGWYRTGDLGEFDADGDLYLSGRLNERINVGGVKVSPETTERVLLTHESVADAIAFSLPHPTLGEHVAALVVARDGATIDVAELTAFAARHLARHAVPNVVRVVPELGRDGYGKLRRRDLSDRLVRDLEAERSAPDGRAATSDALRHTLVRIWEDVLERPAVSVDENFFAAGGDSLRAARLLTRITSATGVALLMETLFTSPTIELLCEALLATARRGQSSRLIPLRTTGSRAPLFFFDGDVNGGGFYGRFLLDALDPEQPVYLIRPNGVFGEDVPAIEAIADGDTALITGVAPTGPYRLAGYCNGGVVAFEIARRLEAAGERVDVLTLIGSSAPNARLGLLWRLSGGDVVRYEVLRRIANRLRGGSLIKQWPDIARGLWGPKPDGTAAYRTKEFLIYRDRLLRYFPRRYDRTIDLIWAENDYPLLPGNPAMGWNYVSRIRRHTVPGDHVTMLTDHSTALGATIRKIFDTADRIL
jgi:acyl-CoA synthetase (AMP-forming)/AMP-acid ligase II/thioesterase domain-containing protein/aryl carrier-like protein